MINEDLSVTHLVEDGSNPPVNACDGKPWRPVDKGETKACFNCIHVGRNNLAKESE